MATGDFEQLAFNFEGLFAPTERTKDDERELDRGREAGPNRAVPGTDSRSAAPADEREGDRAGSDVGRERDTGSRLGSGLLEPMGQGESGADPLAHSDAVSELAGDHRARQARRVEEHPANAAGRAGDGHQRGGLPAGGLGPGDGRRVHSARAGRGATGEAGSQSLRDVGRGRGVPAPDRAEATAGGSMGIRRRADNDLANRVPRTGPGASDDGDATRAVGAPAGSVPDSLDVGDHAGDPGGLRGDPRPSEQDDLSAPSGEAAGADAAVGQPVDGTAPARADRGPAGRFGGLQGEVARRPLIPVSGPKTRIAANLAALEVLKALEGEQRPATEAERETLSHWTGWGGLSQLFDERSEALADERTRLHEIVGEDGYRQARRSILTAFYTSPDHAKAIWDALPLKPDTPLRALEPGCGAGTFISTAPSQVEMTGVELDPQAAAIAGALNPGDEVWAEDFLSFPEEGYDLAISNVPFSNLSDEGLSLHDRFILGALNRVKPGGYSVMLTSTYTMDSRNPRAREMMYEQADLVGGLRLPRGSFTGTQASADLLVFRRRKPGEQPQPFDWREVTDAEIQTREGRQKAYEAQESDRPIELLSLDEAERVTVPINSYFADESRILGRLIADKDQFGSWAVHAQSFRPTLDRLSEEIRSNLGRQIEQAQTAKLTFDPVEGRPRRANKTVLAEPVGTLAVQGDTVVQRSTSGWEPVKVPRTQFKQTVALIELMGLAKDLVTREAAELEDSPKLEDLRGRVRTAYRDYVHSYGPLNGGDLREKSVKTKDKDDEGNRVVETFLELVPPPAVKRIKRDPRSAVLFALEAFDPDTRTAREAAILTSRQVFIPQTPEKAATVEDALAISLHTEGEIRPETVADLLGWDPFVKGPDELRLSEAERGEFDLDSWTLADNEIFKHALLDPQTVSWQPRGACLSGHVRAKLDQAQRASAHDERYTVTAKALEAVIPEDVPMQDIALEIGSPWIPPKVYERFLRSLLRSINPEVTVGGLGEFHVTSGGISSSSPLQSVVWGTPHRSATNIFKCLLNGSDLTVTEPDEEADGQRINWEATAQVEQAAERMQAEFASWVWREPEVAQELLEIYNWRFNSLVARDYTPGESDMPLPGLVKSLTPRPHQRAAIARMVAEPTVGMFHAVGAGKSLAMICGVMEQKRLGLIRKPMMVVPNHLVSQMTTDWLTAYPGANVLMIDSHSARDLEHLFAQVTGGSWDAVICSHSAFSNLATTKETEGIYLRDKIAEIDRMISWLEGQDDDASINKLENLRASAEADLEKRLSKRTGQQSALVFENLGVDYLVVDEAHAFKNLGDTESKGMAQSILGAGSARAMDMDIKLRWMRRNYGPRVATFATATPIANSLGEMWVMAHYLRPDLLEAAGVEHLAGWARQFATLEQSVEMTVSGKPAVKRRMSRFQNVPELLAMWDQFADVKLTDDLDLPLPELTESQDGRRGPRVNAVDIGAPMDDFLARLDQRAEDIRAHKVDERMDNFLALTGDGRTFSLDWRLFKPEQADRALKGLDVEDIGEQKVDRAADQISRIYHAAKNMRFEDTQGQTHPTPGALQIVFCDRGTPKTDGSFSVYEELRSQLVDNGVPAEKIAFAQSAQGPVAKADLFKKAREGGIAVLIGSTETMGTGANIQNRALALHHLDAPWRPADLVQREGRLVRQGNQNEEVNIYRYVTERSLDAYMWQTLERKARFINQVMRGKVIGREADNSSSSEELDYAEVKAIALGDPLVAEQVRLTNEVTRLSRRANAGDAELTNLQHRVRTAQEAQANLRAFIADAERVIASQEQNADENIAVGTADKAHRFTHGPAPFEPTTAPTNDSAEALEQIRDHMRMAFTPYEARGPRTEPQYEVPSANLGGPTMIRINGRVLIATLGTKRFGYDKLEDVPISIIHRDLYGPMVENAEEIFSTEDARDGFSPLHLAPLELTLGELHNPTHGVLRRIRNYAMGLPGRVAKAEEQIKSLDADLEAYRARQQELEGGQVKAELEKAKAELKKIDAQMLHGSKARQATPVPDGQLRTEIGRREQTAAVLRQVIQKQEPRAKRLQMAYRSALVYEVGGLDPNQRDPKSGLMDPRGFAGTGKRTGDRAEAAAMLRAAINEAYTPEVAAQPRSHPDYFIGRDADGSPPMIQINGRALVIGLAPTAEADPVRGPMATIIHKDLHPQMTRLDHRRFDDLAPLLMPLAQLRAMNPAVMQRLEEYADGLPKRLEMEVDKIKSLREQLGEPDQAHSQPTQDNDQTQRRRPRGPRL